MYVPYDPYFLEAEFKVMVSEIVLSNVVDTLDMNTKWGKRYGRTLETAETIPLLRAANRSEASTEFEDR